MSYIMSYVRSVCALAIVCCCFHRRVSSQVLCTDDRAFGYVQLLDGDDVGVWALSLPGPFYDAPDAVVACSDRAGTLLNRATYTNVTDRTLPIPADGLWLMPEFFQVCPVLNHDGTVSFEEECVYGSQGHAALCLLDNNRFLNVTFRPKKQSLDSLSGWGVLTDQEYDDNVLTCLNGARCAPVSERTGDGSDLTMECLCDAWHRGADCGTSVFADKTCVAYDDVATLASATVLYDFEGALGLCDPTYTLAYDHRALTVAGAVHVHKQTPLAWIGLRKDPSLGWVWVDGAVPVEMSDFVSNSFYLDYDVFFPAEDRAAEYAGLDCAAVDVVSKRVYRLDCNQTAALSLCQLDRAEYASRYLCYNGGVCESGACECPPPYQGSARCLYLTSDPSTVYTAQSCSNRSSCNGRGSCVFDVHYNDYRCACEDGFGGVFCQETTPACIDPAMWIAANVTQSHTHHDVDAGSLAHEHVAFVHDTEFVKELYVRKSPHPMTYYQLTEYCGTFRSEPLTGTVEEVRQMALTLFDPHEAVMVGRDLEDVDDDSKYDSHGAEGETDADCYVLYDGLLHLHECNALPVYGACVKRGARTCGGSPGACAEVSGTCECGTPSDPYCDGAPDPCTDVRCMHDGVCNADTGLCDCQPDYIGLRCEQYVDICTEDTCRNGGTCILTYPTPGYTCVCTPSFRGDDCSTPVSDCFLPGSSWSDSLVPYPPTFNASRYAVVNASDGCGSINARNVFRDEAPSDFRALVLSNDTVYTDVIGYLAATQALLLDASIGYASIDPALYAVFIGQPDCTFWMPFKSLSSQCNTKYVAKYTGGPKGERDFVMVDVCVSEQYFCLNGGDCYTDTGCVCQPGYDGTYCEQGLDPCEENPDYCRNGGTCSVLSTVEAECVCPSGYSGDVCELVDTCVVRDDGSDACANGGACTPDVQQGTFACECTPGYVGDRCLSISGQCVNGSCACDRGYVGEDCHATHPACDTDPCGIADGRAVQCTVDRSYEAVCQCASGYSGVVCQHVSPLCDKSVCTCADVDCNQHGSCYSSRYSGSQAQCLCQAGYVGNTCLARFDECRSPSFCMNGGSCAKTTVNGRHEFSCTCNSGFSGSRCELKTIAHDSCTSVRTGAEVQIETTDVCDGVYKCLDLSDELSCFTYTLTFYPAPTKLKYDDAVSYCRSTGRRLPRTSDLKGADQRYNESFLRSYTIYTDRPAFSSKCALYVASQERFYVSSCNRKRSVLCV